MKSFRCRWWRTVAGSLHAMALVVSWHRLVGEDRRRACNATTSTLLRQLAEPTGGTRWLTVLGAAEDRVPAMPRPRAGTAGCSTVHRPANGRAGSSPTSSHSRRRAMPRCLPSSCAAARHAARERSLHWLSSVFALDIARRPLWSAAAIVAWRPSGLAGAGRPGTQAHLTDALSCDTLAAVCVTVGVADARVPLVGLQVCAQACRSMSCCSGSWWPACWLYADWSGLFSTRLTAAPRSGASRSALPRQCPTSAHTPARWRCRCRELAAGDSNKLKSRALDQPAHRSSGTSPTLNTGRACGRPRLHCVYPLRYSARSPNLGVTTLWADMLTHAASRLQRVYAEHRRRAQLNRRCPEIGDGRHAKLSLRGVACAAAPFAQTGRWLVSSRGRTTVMLNCGAPVDAALKSALTPRISCRCCRCSGGGGQAAVVGCAGVNAMPCRWLALIALLVWRLAHPARPSARARRHLALLGSPVAAQRAAVPAGRPARQAERDAIARKHAAVHDRRARLRHDAGAAL